MTRVEELIENLPRFSEKHSIEETRAFLDHLGAPDEEMKIIHVAGTNGKGSVCSYLSEMLAAAGYRTGLFTSPHLERINERFVVKNPGKTRDAADRSICIADEELEYYSDILEEKLTEYRNSDPGNDRYRPTYFEYLFFIGMLFFKGTDCLILETGLGGRLDATNSVRHPVLTVITRIAMDHMQYLGDTKQAIAREKAGIIKQGIPVVAWESDSIGNVIKDRAHQLNAPYTGVKEADINKLTKTASDKPVAFFCKTEYDKYDVVLNTAARYQAGNALIAIRAAETIEHGTAGIHISKDDILEGLRSMFWPGRMEEMTGGVYLDGAHNPDGIAAFLDSAEKIAVPEGRKRILIFGGSGDKALTEMLSLIVNSRLFDRVVFVPLSSSRSADTHMLRETFDRLKGKIAADHEGIAGDCEGAVLCKEYTPETREYQSAAQALTCERAFLGQGDLLFIAGSLYLAGECRALLGSGEF